VAHDSLRSTACVVALAWWIDSLEALTRAIKTSDTMSGTLPKASTPDPDSDSDSDSDIEEDEKGLLEFFDVIKVIRPTTFRRRIRRVCALEALRDTRI